MSVPYTSWCWLKINWPNGLNGNFTSIDVIPKRKDVLFNSPQISLVYVMNSTSTSSVVLFFYPPISDLSFKWICSYLAKLLARELRSYTIYLHLIATLFWFSIRLTSSFTSFPLIFLWSANRYLSEGTFLIFTGILPTTARTQQDI